jgi:hypothetical protein
MERDNLDDLGVDVRISKCIFKKWDADTDWLNLALDRDRRQALVKAVMNLRVA